MRQSMMAELMTKSLRPHSFFAIFGDQILNKARFSFQEINRKLDCEHSTFLPQILWSYWK